MDATAATRRATSNGTSTAGGAHREIRTAAQHAIPSARAVLRRNSVRLTSRRAGCRTGCTPLNQVGLYGTLRDTVGRVRRVSKRGAATPIGGQITMSRHHVEVIAEAVVRLDGRAKRSYDAPAGCIDDADHRLPAPPASYFAFPLRRPSPARPRELRLASPSLRVQANGRPPQTAHGGPFGLGRADQDLGRVETVPRVRHSRHGPALAATPFPQALGQLLRPAQCRPPGGQRRDHTPHPKNGRCQSAMGRSPNPWRTAEARN
jgi:hypothetical protein